MDNSTQEMETLKARLRATWMAGDFGQIAKYSDHWGSEFLSRLPLPSGGNALDVACGTGNVSLAAARLGLNVVGVDIAPNLLEQARARAEGEGLKIQFDEGDAEQLPYPDAAFDMVVSMFGAMFAPNPAKTAAELLRVCRPGGVIAMANWTPEGFSGQIFKLNAAYTPPPPGVQPPVMWGDEKSARERLQHGVANLTLTPRKVIIALPFNEEDVVEYFRLYFGPTQRAFDALDPERQKDLRRDLVALWKQHNRATDGSTAVESEYLEVVASRAGA